MITLAMAGCATTPKARSGPEVVHALNTLSAARFTIDQTYDGPASLEDYRVITAWLDKGIGILRRDSLLTWEKKCRGEWPKVRSSMGPYQRMAFHIKEIEKIIQ
jgi:hypothetical protein